MARALAGACPTADRSRTMAQNVDSWAVEYARWIFIFEIDEYTEAVQISHRNWLLEVRANE